MRFGRPKAGQPAGDLVGSASIWASLLELLAAWKRGELGGDRSREFAKRDIWIKNDTGAALESGQISQIKNMGQPSSGIVEAFHQTPTMECENPVWHSKIDDVFPLVSAVPLGELTAYPEKDWASVQVTIVDPSDRYVMIDPADPTRLKTADAGIYKILELDQTNDRAVVDLATHQPLWRYELKEDSNTPLTTDAKLIRLDGTTYHDTIELTDPLSVTLDGESGDTGYCLHCGNKFISIVEAPALKPFPRIRFRTAAVIADRQVLADVIWLQGKAKDPATGNVLSVGDQVTITDPNNHHPGIHINAIGMAYFRDTIPANPPTPEIPARWEMEPTSWPMNRVIGYLGSCQPRSKTTDNAGYVYTNNQLQEVTQADAEPFDMSGSLNRDLPIEFGELTSGGNAKQYTFNVKNPLGLDLIHKKYNGGGSGPDEYYPTTFAKVSAGLFSDPTNLIVPKSDGTKTGGVDFWIIVKGMHFATWGITTASGTKGQVFGDAPTSLGLSPKFFDGGDPRACGVVNFVWGFELKCDLDQEPVEFHRDPENNRYIIVRAGMLLPTPMEYTYTPDIEVKRDYLGVPQICVDQLKFLGFCDPDEPDEDCWPGIECEDI